MISCTDFSKTFDLVTQQEASHGAAQPVCACLHGGARLTRPPPSSWQSSNNPFATSPFDSSDDAQVASCGQGGRDHGAA